MPDVWQKVLGPTTKLVGADPDGTYQLSLVLKRTYRVLANGTCALADEQEPIEEKCPSYDEVEPPLESPRRWDNDSFAFKPRTDVVLQGSAHTYGRRLTEVLTELRFGAVSRQVRVTGDRECEWGPSRKPRFTPPRAFESMPLRYDRAYGGQDRLALERHGDPVADAFATSLPEFRLLANTRYHYPRNPAGTGYLVEEPQSGDRVAVPNLDFPFDPVTPDRLSVGGVDRWLFGPLPAGFDWYAQSWFPRLAHILSPPRVEIPPAPIQEVALGWSPADILTRRGLLDGRPDRFSQGASPGLAVPEVRADEVFVLRNISPSRPERVVRLPGDVPRAWLQITLRDRKELKPFLGTVVFRSDEDRVIMVWNLRCPVSRPYRSPELEEMNFELR